jgi:hypothetical protein
MTSALDVADILPPLLLSCFPYEASAEDNPERETAESVCLRVYGPNPFFCELRNSVMKFAFCAADSIFFWFEL